MIFGKVESLGKFKYTSGLWNAWVELRKAVRIEVVGAVLPGRWRLVDVLDFMEEFLSLPGIIHLSIVGLLARIGIIQLKNLAIKSCEEWVSSMERVRNVGGEVRRLARLILRILSSADFNLDGSGEGMDCWRWVDKKQPCEGWDIGNLQVYNFIHIPTIPWDWLNGV